MTQQSEQAKAFAWCTGPRAALMGALAVLATLTLIMQAEIPLSGALQAAVAGERARLGADDARACGAAVGASRSALACHQGPLASFDGRAGGYGEAEARLILAAMALNGEAGKRAYLERHWPLDMAFPFFYGPAIAVIWLYLVGAWGLPRAFGVLALAPLVAGGLDLAENLSVRALVEAGAAATIADIEQASTLTVWKYRSLLVGAAPTTALLFAYLLRRSLRAS